MRRSGARAGRRRRQGTRVGFWPGAALVLTGLVVAGAIAFEVAAQPAPPVPQPVGHDPPDAGAWYCPVTAGEDERSVVSVAAVGEEASEVTVVRYPEGRAQPDPVVEVRPSAQHDIILEDGGQRRPLAVFWRGGPVAVAWRVEANETAGGRCVTAPAPVWHLTGFDTTARSRSTLHLFNPFEVDAIARVVFGTPTGREALVLTESILVQAGTAARLNLGEFEPEQPDLAVTVEVQSGRLVAGGEVALRPLENQPGPSGRAVLAAVPTPSLSVATASGQSGDGASSWLSVYNPGDREAAVEVQVSDPLPDGPALLGEQSIPAGGVVRIDLGDASSAPVFGATLTSVNEVPVVASLVTHRESSAGEEVAASTGYPPSSGWALVGDAAADGRIGLFNPGSQAVTIAAHGDAIPAEWSEVRLTPNQYRSFELSDAAERPVTGLRLAADGPFVPVLLMESTGEPLRLWTVGATPSVEWGEPTEHPPLLRDPRLPTRPLGRPEDTQGQ